MGQRSPVQRGPGGPGGERRSPRLRATTRARARVMLARMSVPSRPRLVGVLHLPPLPGSPRAADGAPAIARAAAREAKLLASAGFELIIVENFGDAPFFRGSVPPVTIAAMTACALAVREACPALPLGI